MFGDTAKRTFEFAIELHRQPQGLDLIEALLRAIAAQNPDEPLARLDLVRAKVLRDTPSLAGAIRAYETDLEAHFAEWIAQRTRRDRDDFDVQLLAAFIVAARRVSLDRWRASGGVPSMAELARVALAPVASAAANLSLVAYRGEVVAAVCGSDVADRLRA